MDSLYASLVGTTIEYRKSGDVVDVDKELRATKVKLKKDLNSLMENLDGRELVTALSSLVYYYTKQSFYCAIRSTIELGRYRSMVVDYLNDKNPEDITNDYLRLLKLKSVDRESLLVGLRYFLETYPSRFATFKPILTKSELLFL